MSTNMEKTLCYILRHHPEKFNLKLDKYGYVKITTLVDAINKKDSTAELTNYDIKQIVKTDPKDRYTIKNKKIKCNFGHSIPIELEPYDNCDIPSVLYHGTTSAVVGKIMKKGLQPRKRQYVHLTNDLKVARQVGSRYTKNQDVLTILSINARKMIQDGLTINSTDTSTWLTDEVPSKYITVMYDKDSQLRRSVHYGKI